MATTKQGLQQELSLYAQEYINCLKRGDTKMAQIYEELGHEIHEKLNEQQLKEIEHV